MKGPAELARLDGMAQAELCRRREVSSDELWAACLARIDALNPLLRAVVTASAESRPSRTSRDGRLSGAPFLAKDSLPWPGMRWSMGSRVFRGNVATQHTELSRRLAEAGLVCAGKTAMSEFGLLASTETLLAGVTHNPWNLACSAGGSSGGSAAAVAAGIVPFAHASDGGSSIRVPASMCGVFGFMPSRGRTVSANPGASAFADMTSDHCVSRTVRDSAFFLSITEDATGGAPVGFVERPIARRLRIGAWSKTILGEEPAPAVRAAYDDTAALLQGLGHIVEPIAAPSFDAPELIEACFLVAGAAASAIVDGLDRTRGTPVQENELEPFTWSLIDAFLARGDDAVEWARTAFARATRAYRDVAGAYDVILTPTLAVEPWLVGHLSPVLSRTELLSRLAKTGGYTPIHNIAGNPAMSVPLHVSASGLPIGMHFAANPGHDATLLALAYQLEEARPWRDRWAPYSILRIDHHGAGFPSEK